MEFETESKSGGGCDLRVKIAELEGRLREERESSAMLRSESELAKYSAKQEVDRYKRECSSLRENVARLAEDCSILRERELRDQEKIRILMEEIERKVTEFDERFVELKVKNRDLEFGKMRVQDEVQTWKKKYGKVEAHALRLVDENLRLAGTDKRTAEDEVLKWKEKYEELEARSSGIADKNSHGTGTGRKENELKEKVLELETKNRHLECAKKKMEDEILEWKKDYGELKKHSLELLDKNSRLMEIERKKRHPKLLMEKLVDRNCPLVEEEKTATATDEELKKRTADPMQGTEEDLLLTPGIRRKRSFLAADIVNGNVGSGHVSDDDEDCIPLIHRKRIIEAARGEKIVSNFSLNLSSGCLAPSMTPSASSKPSGTGKFRVKETAAAVADEQTPAL